MHSHLSVSGCTPEQLGFSAFFQAQLETLAPSSELTVARILSDWGERYLLGGCRRAQGVLRGRLRDAADPEARPTTGDWVVVDDRGDLAVVHHLLERRTALRRRAAGSEAASQIVAANVDVYFVVTAAHRDHSPRRMERYLTAIWDSGAVPVLVLNKVDLVADAADFVSELEAVALGVEVLSTSALDGRGVDALAGRLELGKTYGFVGSSGVGKSSLVNRLLGAAQFETRGLGVDAKGQHTTTRRELVVLEGGALVMDTPGMRELGMVADEAGLQASFSDIAEWAEGCRFRDCRHDSEPGCAVVGAIESGGLAAERLRSYRKLEREIAAAQARQDPALASNMKRRWKAIHKTMRATRPLDPKRRR